MNLLLGDFRAPVLTLTHHHQQSPDQVDPAVEVSGVLAEQTHQDGGQNEKQHVAYLKRERDMIKTDK